MTSALVGCGALVWFGTAAAPSDGPDPKPRPPLGQTDVNDRWVGTQAIPGRTLLRFDTVIMNVGYGAFEGAPGSRTSCATRRPSAASTPLAADRGPHAARPRRVPGRGGVEEPRGLLPVRQLGPAGVGRALPLPEQRRPEQACAAKEPGYTGLLRMGISEDWGDFYRSQLWDQWVDVTDVTPGQGRLRATVDPRRPPRGVERRQQLGGGPLGRDPRRGRRRPHGRHARGRGVVRLSASQVRINQRVGPAGVRRANALEARAGL